MTDVQAIVHHICPRFFVDFEFIEDGVTIDLVSIGIVASNGLEYYAVSSDAQLDRANDWVRANVLPHLPLYGHAAWKRKADIAREVREFIGPIDESVKPEFWTYYGSYDWVVFCQLFGRMIDLPKGYPMHCMDLKQYSRMLGNPPNPPQDGAEHNALEDARWNRKLYEFLRAYGDGGVRAEATPPSPHAQRLSGPAVGDFVLWSAILEAACMQEAPWWTRCKVVRAPYKVADGPAMVDLEPPSGHGLLAQIRGAWVADLMPDRPPPGKPQGSGQVGAAKVLTGAQHRELRRLAEKPQTTYGSARIRVQNNLVTMRLARFVDDAGKECLLSVIGAVGYRSVDLCEITEAGRAALRSQPIGITLPRMKRRRG